MNPTDTHRAVRCIAYFGAFLLISASATLGAYFGFTLGAHQHVAVGVIFAAAALGGEVLKPIAVAGAFDMLRAREFLRACACTALAIVCVTYSIAAELSLSAGSRGDMASARQLSADAVQSARERRTRAVGELAELPPARMPAEIEPLIAKLKTTPGANGCVGLPDGPVSRKACGEALALQSEAARAQRRAHLEASISDADRILHERAGNSVRTAGAADPLASALSAYASALGHSVKADAIAPWLALIPVLFLEMGSALALIVVRAIGSAPVQPATAAMPSVPVGERATDTASAVAARADRASGLAADATRKPSGGRDDDDSGPHNGHRRLGVMADRIRQKGGRLEGGQRAIAKALGVSKSRANELLHEMAAAGAVRLAVGRTGTTVELATA